MLFVLQEVKLAVEARERERELLDVKVDVVLSRNKENVESLLLEFQDLWNFSH